jgi:5-methylcytosine-specific restriction protein A
MLSEHPLCVECERQGRITPATVVDHIVPHKGNLELFWDENNLQAICKRCHDGKTAGEGRWGKKGVVYCY